MHFHYIFISVIISCMNLKGSLFVCFNESLARHGLPARLLGPRTCEPSGHIPQRVLHVRLRFQTPASAHNLQTAPKYNWSSSIIPKPQIPVPLFCQAAPIRLFWCPECFSAFYKVISVQQTLTLLLNHKMWCPLMPGKMYGTCLGVLIHTGT